MWNWIQAAGIPLKVEEIAGTVIIYLEGLQEASVERRNQRRKSSR